MAHDAGRDAFLRALLVRLGLKVSPEKEVNGINGSEMLTPIHVFSVSELLNRAIYKSLMTADQHQYEDDDIITLIDTHDTFRAQYISSLPYSMHSLLESLNGYHNITSVDPTPKRLVFHSSLTAFPRFSPAMYFTHLPRSSTIGQSLAYVEVTSSTQTLLDRNPILLRMLPSGFTIVATSQLNGRGRAGNAWISPRGSLAFSFVLRLPSNLTPRLVFVQYLVSLAIVEGIHTYAPGWEDVNVSIKWPNDIYGKPRYTDRWEKIGGIIVNSTYLEKEYVLVIGMIGIYELLTIGCGINTLNPHPTTSLLHIIPEDLEPPSHERLLAKLLSTFSDMYAEFIKTGFRTFESKYYLRWLHTAQIVSIENGIVRGRIEGISCEDGGSGGLLVDEVDLDGLSLGKKLVEVIADGNSFDMMKGLLRRKR